VGTPVAARGSRDRAGAGKRKKLLSWIAEITAEVHAFGRRISSNRETATPSASLVMQAFTPPL
jgi:hypothetical protein